MNTILRAVFCAACATSAHAADTRQFAFGPGKPPAGYTAVTTDTVYTSTRGYGLEPGTAPDGAHPWYFSVDLPEGNYTVTLALGDDAAPARTTVKAELRRLMLENVDTAKGQTVTKTFTVNVRTPQIPTGGEVKLKAPRETVDEAWNWDRRLTLEINGTHPAVRTIAIAPATVPTLYLLGDSTVCDQPAEPYASWGQMLPRFFKPGIAVANHGESGETYRDSIARRRLDKVVSALRPGDVVLMQFGHNDQKQIKEGKGGPFTTYKAEIKLHVDAIRAHGGLPVIVSSMERRGFDADGHVIPSLQDYAEAARQSARELRVPFIDLNAMSKTLYEALGPEGSKAAFAEPAPGRLDNTHHDDYGSYELAKAVVLGMRDAKVPAAAFIVDDFAFDPAHPDPVTAVAVSPSPHRTAQRPLGDEAHR
ncbi:rhamnogalacturonan acetylesterase [Massilia pinisoli]|uniref:Rhamnogalacturonan acetylesterase n=1 Tax=Massilia pinisoli TaxID=1772194 RepID=A0ABT1ZTD9_9BURK|nr:rhamnogalacturonan acetylesterase [Massilia pinisoli]MCS0583178.1 rhamnogalacturonan acetylesterase [Massilia pinisoli]